MPRIYKAPSAEKIVALLKKEGGMTGTAIAKALNMNRATVGSAIRTARAKKWIYIHGYDRNYGAGGAFSPRYGIGRGSDAEPPKADVKADKKRYAEKMREVIRLKWQVKRGRVQDHWMQQLAGKSMAPRVQIKKG